MNLVQLVISFVSVGENQFRIQKACNIILKEHAFVVVSEISNYLAYSFFLWYQHFCFQVQEQVVKIKFACLAKLIGCGPSGMAYRYIFTQWKYTVLL